MLVNGKSGATAKYPRSLIQCSYLSRDARKRIKQKAKKSVKRVEERGWKKDQRSS